MSHRIVSPVFSAFALLSLFGLLAAQDKPETALKKNEDNTGYLHEPSRSQLILPKDWVVVPPQAIGSTSFLGLRQPAKNSGDPSIELTVAWSPLNIKFEDARAQELQLLQMLYSKDKVETPEDIRVGNTPGVKIVVNNGPTFNDKEAGVVYLFDTGPDEKNRWKVKVRATVSKLHKAEALKAVDDVVNNQLKW